MLAAVLAACRGAQPAVMIIAPTAMPSVTPPPILAAPVSNAPQPTLTPIPPAYQLNLPAGWELASAQTDAESDAAYAFTAILPSADPNAPAAIATGLIVPAHNLDLAAFVEAAAAELQNLEGAAVLSAGIDGLLRPDARPVGVLAYTLASHAQLGTALVGRQYTLAPPAGDQFMVVTCLTGAVTAGAGAQICDSLALAIAFD